MNTHEFLVSTDDQLLRLDWVVAQIKGSYWGGWRTEDLIRRSLKSSLNFGLYWNPPDSLEDFPTGLIQVGFARVITDGATFNYVCDVIVEEKYRHSGLGKLLMRHVLAHGDLATGVSVLGTRDAHGFYEQFDYKRVEMMKRIPPHK